MSLWEVQSLCEARGMNCTLQGAPDCPIFRFCGRRLTDEPAKWQADELWQAMPEDDESPE